MKSILILFFLIACYSVFGTTYPFKNLQQTSAYDFDSEILNNNEPTIVIFLNSQCLFYSNQNRTCLLGEKMIDQTLPTIAPGVQVRFIDMFEDGYMLARLNITNFTTIVLYIKGQQIEKLEGLSSTDLYANFHSLNQRINRP